MFPDIFLFPVTMHPETSVYWLLLNVNAMQKPLIALRGKIYIFCIKMFQISRLANSLQLPKVFELDVDD